MARKTRFASPEFAHHVTNRRVDRQVLFREHVDYTAFRELLEEGTKRHQVRLFGFCAMPNHFHLLVQPDTDVALSEFMQWVTCSYACTFRQQTETVGNGHVFQRRFWNAPAYDEAAFIAMLRYVEANPSRAGLVERAEAWEWSSLTQRHVANRILSPLPVQLPRNWETFVNIPQPQRTLSRIRRATVPTRGRALRNEPRL
jgi:putative transposase